MSLAAPSARRPGFGRISDLARVDNSYNVGGF
jgi:hypothetical protein